MRNLLAIDRRNELVAIIHQNNSVRASELAKHFNVSTETIRKDLIFLEDKGLIVRGHGGAIISEGFFDLPLRIKLKTNSEIKKEIAIKAASLIPEKSSVFIGPGSTETMIAEILLNKPGYRIFTNSIMIANLFCDNKNNPSKLVLFGGEIETISTATVGAITLNALKSIYFDYAVLGTSGFQNLLGPATFSYGELAIASAAIKMSRNSMIIGESSKFEHTSQYMYAKWDDVDLLITDFKAKKSPLFKDIQSKVEIITTEKSI